MKCSRLICGLLFAAGSAFAQIPALQFVGCASDGQLGPVAAPHGRAPSLAISLDAAARLAWYKAANAPGVLAPRGWRCFGTYGSSGAALYVSPEPISKKLLFSEAWKGFVGPAIQISSMNGGTSGRFEVARKIARLFPDHIQFTRQAIAEGIEPARDFPVGPYPHDKIAYRTKTLVEFETPAQSEGLGTQSRLQANSEPIIGFVFLSMPPDDDPYDISLEVRLPSDIASLGPVIRSAIEETLPKSSIR